MNVRIATNDSDLERIAPVLLELRDQFNDAEALIAQIKRQQSEGYRLAFAEENDEVLCVAGFVISNKLAWGKHIYVDDLVTSAKKRSTGAGKCLMDWLKQHCRDNDCNQLHLDSGVQRFAVHRFYLREGFNINSHHFALTIE